jgi:hypothetical protein
MRLRVLIAHLPALLGVGAVLALSTPAFAQVTLPQVPSINPNTDLVQVIPGGFPRATSVFASVGLLNATNGYAKAVPLTGFSLTFANSQSYLALNPAGTLATGTVTLAPSPSDGARECIFTTQTITALTVSANSGQTINNGLTAASLAANTGVCYLYSSSNLTWDRA